MLDCVRRLASSCACGCIVESHAACVCGMQSAALADMALLSARTIVAWHLLRTLWAFSFSYVQLAPLPGLHYVIMCCGQCCTSFWMIRHWRALSFAPTSAPRWGASTALQSLWHLASWRRIRSNRGASRGPGPVLWKESKITLPLLTIWISLVQANAVPYPASILLVLVLLMALWASHVLRLGAAVYQTCLGA
jgi:hypothetical protein